MNTWRLLSLSSLLLASGASFALTQTEGFDGPAFTFENSFFLHDFNGIGSGDPFWEIVDWTSQSSEQSLFLAPALDIITFDLQGSEIVTQAEVYVNSAGGSGSVTFVGFDVANNPLSDTLEFTQGQSGWQLAEANANFVTITEIQLQGFETNFDDLSVEVVPEPATMTLLGLGVAAFAARRKRKSA